MTFFSIHVLGALQDYDQSAIGDQSSQEVSIITFNLDEIRLVYVSL